MTTPAAHPGTRRPAGAPGRPAAAFRRPAGGGARRGALVAAVAAALLAGLPGPARADTAPSLAGDAPARSVTGPARADAGPPHDNGPGAPVDTTPPVRIDAGDPDLRLADGARLAPGRVLDIKSVVETHDGEERREDTNEKVKFALQAEVLFDKNSARLGREATSRIRTIAAEIQSRHATTVRVFGFTDSLGSSVHGDKLSKQRANAVQRELAKHLDASVTYEVRGYGEQYPIADNSTEEGRRKNRRVEVSFARDA